MGNISSEEDTVLGKIETDIATCLENVVDYLVT
jgi:hypothetical protein